MLTFAAIAYLTIAFANFGRLVTESRSEFSVCEFALYGLLWPMELVAWIESIVRSEGK